MYRIRCCLLAVMMVVALTLTNPSDVQAGYPYVVAPAPAVVGYTAQRRGIFGQRVVMRPVVAPVTAAVPAVSVARPVVSAYYAPAVPTVSAYYAPPAAPVAAFYPPPVAPVVTHRVPVVTTYRVPVFYGW